MQPPSVCFGPPPLPGPMSRICPTRVHSPPIVNGICQSGLSPNGQQEAAGNGMVSKCPYEFRLCDSPWLCRQKTVMVRSEMLLQQPSAEASNLAPVDFSCLLLLMHPSPVTSHRQPSEHAARNQISLCACIRGVGEGGFFGYSRALCPCTVLETTMFIPAGIGVPRKARALSEHRLFFFSRPKCGIALELWGRRPAKMQEVLGQAA